MLYLAAGVRSYPRLGERIRRWRRDFLQETPVAMVERLLLAMHEHCRVLVVRPGSVVVDRHPDPVLDRLERVLEERVRADAVGLGSAGRCQLEAARVAIRR